MIKKKKSKANIVYNLTLVILAMSITLVAIINGAFVQEGYVIKIGEVSQRKYKAIRRTVNRIATEANRQAAKEAAAEMKPLLMRNSTVDDRVKKNLDAFFSLADDIRDEYTREKARLEVAMPSINTVDEPASWEMPQEAVQDETVDSEGRAAQSAVINIPSLPIALADSQTQLLLEMGETEYVDFEVGVYDVIEQVLEQGLQEVDAKSLSLVKDELEELGLDAESLTLGYEIVASYLEPNYVVDVENTERSRQEIANQYETVMILKDQTIVDEGEIIREEAYDILDSLGLISGGFSEKIPPIIGAVIIMLVVFTVALMYISIFHKNILLQRKEALLLFLIYAFIILITWLIIGAPYQMLPLLVFTMIVAMLFDVRLAAVLNVCLTIMALLIFKGDVTFFIFFTVAGLAISFLSRLAAERSKMLTIGFLAIIINFALSLGISLFFEKSYSSEALMEAGIAAANGIFTVIICIGSMPIWEAAFGVVTPVKLLDLINPNSVVLRRLAIEAPGTYHHSLIVANLAESAAYDIGANPSIASAGGYYHDIGKLKYPQYFIENQVGENPHNYMDAYSSTQVIFSHVAYGIELAGTHRLPKIIKDMITQHHGNTMVKYFYYKAKSGNPGQEVDCNDFRYKGPIPQTKEAAIIMLADTVEAAVRAMMPSATAFDQVEDLITKLIKDKLDDGQLTDSELTIKNIDMVAVSFMRVFKGMYHERIRYPGDEQKEDADEKKGAAAVAIEDEKNEEGTDS